MEFDLIIRNGTVIDGSGRPGVVTDVGIRGDRIAAVDDLAAATAAQALDAAGKIVSPGFIDIHTHSDFTLLLDPQGEGMVRQGVTTNVIGNCSLGCYPVRGEGRAASAGDADVALGGGRGVGLDGLGGLPPPLQFPRCAALNVASLVGHTAIRTAAMGYDQRAPTADELADMRRLVAEAMEQGAVGMSVGLTYAPSGYADTEELVSLAEVVGRYGGLLRCPSTSGDGDAVRGQAGDFGDCPPRRAAGPDVAQQRRG